MTAVVDASVAAKWVVAEQCSEHAATLLGYDVLCAPAYWQAEAVNVIWSKVRAGELDAEDGTQRVSVLLRAPVQSIPVAPFMADAFAIAVRCDVTVYDALYISLAQQRGIPFVTADQRLVRKITEEGLRPLLVWVGQLVVGP